jgi:monoamine oxidase
MSRSESMAQLLRLARLAAQSEKTGASAQETIEQDAFAQEARSNASRSNETPRDAGRRRFTQGAIAGVATVAAGAMAPSAWAGAAKLRRMITGGGGVAIVGAGMAGLACATELARKGIQARVFEADTRVGGRCKSLRGVFPGQVAELGAEFINTSHHVMVGYARTLGLTLEDASAFPGSRYYDFGGSRYTEAQVVEEFQAFSSFIGEDLKTLSYPTADRFTEADSLFDFMTLDDYLEMQGAGGLLRKLISGAYASEYGSGTDALSSVSFLRFVYGDKRDKFGSFGSFGDTNLHVIEGTDRIATGLAQRLPTPVAIGHRLVAVRKLASGQVRLTFDVDGRTLQSDHDAVVLTLPFTVLRDVHLDASLELPAWKRFAIDNAAMGDNSKMMVGFNQSYWYIQHGSSGSGYSDRAHLQNTWETNPSNGGEARGVLTHYTGGAEARALNPKRMQANAKTFLNDLEQVLPGANRMARRNARGQVLAVGENWSRNPYSKGSYSCPRPGYFTTTAHNEAKAVGNLMFAGEHTSSFYEWQGFMEGAALSGLRAAAETCTLLRVS